jgi:uncharacterized protein (TIGR03435 family)
MLTRIVGLSLASGILFIGSAAAQDPSARSVEVASIRAHAFQSDDYFRGWAFGMEQAGGVCVIGPRKLAPSGNRITLPNMTLCGLISLAYDMPGFRIAGAPAWMMKMEASNFYDVALKAEGDATLNLDQSRALLQALLADRFQLKLHRDAKTQPVYELTVGKNGPKLREVPAGVEPPNTGVAMGTYLSLISKFLDHPLVDKTGLSGRYQYKWEENELRDQLAQGGKPAPSIFSAVQEQLGLELKAVNEGSDVLVIDRAEKPAEN